MHKYILSIILFLFITSCGKKAVDHTVVFSAELGFEDTQVGSNIPILQSYTNREGFSDSFLVDIPRLKIHDNNIYIADSYNKKINMFSLNNKDSASPNLLLSIPNKGENYQFARPYDVFIDASRAIYVLSSIQDFESYEVQNYSNQTAGIKNYDQFQKDLREIPLENFNIYKFSSDGAFLYKLDTVNFYYPNYINSDNLGNIYLGFDYITNDQKQTSIVRYNSSGTKDLSFDTKNLDMITNIQGTNYIGTINSINNYKNKEELALVVQYQPTTNSEGEFVPALIENIFSSISSYKIPTKQLLQESVAYSNIADSIIGVDTKDRLFLQSYDIDINALKIRVVDSKKVDVYHTPAISTYYTLFDYFIDNKGNLYNYLLDRNEKLIVLQWHIEKQDTKEEQKESN